MDKKAPRREKQEVVLTASSNLDDHVAFENGAPPQSLGRRDRVDGLVSHTLFRTQARTP